MKNAKKILILLLTLTLAFGLFACGGDGGKDPCTACVDENGDGKCDVCEKDMPKEPTQSLLLIEEGYPNFQFVVPSSDFALSVRDALRNQIIKELNKKLEDDVVMVAEGSGEDTEKEIGVLVGNITTRGDEYKIDPHTLGKDGYVVKIVANKVVINAGSDESLIIALEEFADNILGISNSEITDVTMSSEDNMIEIQDDYKVTSLAVNGTDMRGYTIAADLDRTGYWAAAIAIQNTIYDRTGYWLEVVKLSEATEKSIVFKHIDKVFGEDSFKVYASGTQIIIECAFDNKLSESASEFIYEKITKATGDVNFTGDVFKKDISVVYYDDFGAKGDGKTDDFKAIYDTHKFANECGQTVKADGSKTYRIANNMGTDGELIQIIIKTNVDWCGAKFVIDDTIFTSEKTSPMYYSKYNQHIFAVRPDDAHDEKLYTNKTETGKAIIDKIMQTGGIKPGTTNIQVDIGWDGPLMILPYNSSHYISRDPGNPTKNSSMHESILLDKDGNVSPDTPITFYYTDITSIYVYRLDESAALTVENATFTTKVCNFNTILWGTPSSYSPDYALLTTMFKRGLTCSRSYTTIKNIEHYVEGEVKVSEQIEDGKIVKAGMGYSSFFSLSNSVGVTIEDCVLTARRNYRTPYNGSMTGTVDLAMTNCANVLINKCQQSNFWITVDPDTLELIPSTEYTPGALTSMSNVDKSLVGLDKIKMCWGIMSSNNCKSMEYRNSTLSRFDAHAPITNGKIVNCSINDAELTGFGEFVLENVDWYPYLASTPLFNLRDDYGGNWNGTVVVKNVRAHLIKGSNCFIVENSYQNFYWGYQCAIPSISIDNLDCYDRETGEPLVGYEVTVLRNASSKNVFGIDKHLGTTSYGPTKYSFIDNDKDTYVDEPLFDSNRDGKVDADDLIDLDGNGAKGNTCIKYEAFSGGTSVSIPESMVATDPNINRYANANPVKPPEYIKIINNDGVDGSGGYGFKIYDTSGEGVSDGTWWDDGVENYGGFFGNTKFIYGEGENDFFFGTASEDTSGTFIFTKNVPNK
jgi:hypothetical protein